MISPGVSLRLGAFVNILKCPAAQAMSGPADSSFAQLEKAAVPVRPTMANNARYWANYYHTMSVSVPRPTVLMHSACRINTLSPFCVRALPTSAAKLNN